MDFGFSPEEERFAQEVRELFLQNEELVKKARQEYRSGAGFGPGVFGLMRKLGDCLLYTSPSPRDATLSRMPSSA